MSKLTKLSQILAGNSSNEEVYENDAKKRFYRSKKGVYARTSFDFIQLIKAWEEVVGALMANNTAPLKIKSNSLIIAAKHAVFANELSLMAPQLLDKIFLRFPQLKGKIKRIKFYHSDYNATLFNTKQNQKAKTTHKKELHPFSPEYKQQKKKIDSLLEDIEDEEIKNSLRKYLLN